MFIRCRSLRRNSSPEMIIFISIVCLVGVLGIEYTLPGVCPDVELEENLDHNRFSGLWYNVASYASDGREIPDCSTLEFQKNNSGYTYVETHVKMEQGNRTQKIYRTSVVPTFEAGNYAQFLMNHKAYDKMFEYPYIILATDYDGYAIAYTCNWLKEKIRKHSVYTWVLTRTKEKLQGELLKKVDNSLSKYPELAEHRESFVSIDFSDASCAYTQEREIDSLNSNFW